MEEEDSSYAMSMTDIALLCAACPIAVGLRLTILAWFSSKRPESNTTWCVFTIDFVCLGVSGTLFMTVFSNCPDLLLCLMFCSSGVIVIFILRSRDRGSPTNGHTEYDRCGPITACTSKHRTCISNYRGYALLAVITVTVVRNFQEIFPQKFDQRTAYYGLGLMDVGEGAFVVANGLVCHQSRPTFTTTRDSGERLKHVWMTIRSVLVLCILGIVHAGQTWSSAVTWYEYGLCWNFFLTLTVIKIMASILLTFIPVGCAPIIGVIIAGMYQYMLQELGLNGYILDRPDDSKNDTSFFDANRLGLCSCLGYLAIYLIAVVIGRFLLQQRDAYTDRLAAFVKLVVVDCLLWVVLINMRIGQWIEPISKRLSNLGYITWTLAQQIFILCGLCFIELVEVSLTPYCQSKTQVVSQPVFSLMEAINRNGLVLYLLAHVLAGITNIYIQTATAQPYIAHSLSLGSILLLSAIATVLHLKKITVKCW